MNVAVAASLSLTVLAALVPPAPAAASNFAATLPCTMGSIRKGASHGPNGPVYPVVTNSTSQTLTAGRQVTVVVTLAGRQQVEDIVISPGIVWPSGLLMEGPNAIAGGAAATCTAGLVAPPGPVLPVTSGTIKSTAPTHSHPALQ